MVPMHGAETRPALNEKWAQAPTASSLPAVPSPRPRAIEHVVGLARGRVNVKANGRAASSRPDTQVRYTQILRAPPCPAPTAPLVVCACDVIQLVPPPYLP